MEVDNKMEIEQTTLNKKDYVERWHSHINWALSQLTWTPTEELSNEIKATINKLKELVIKVAEDKGLE